MSPPAPPFSRLPPELIESVFEALPTHEALLAFAHTCSTFHDIASRGTHIAYGRLTLSLDHHKPVWELLAALPPLARRVRVLVLIDDPELADGPTPCTPLSHHAPRHELVDMDSADAASEDTIVAACRNMDRVARVEVRYARKEACRRTLDALSIVCEEFSHVQDVALRGRGIACDREDDVTRLAAHPIWESSAVKAFTMDFVSANMWLIIPAMLHPSSALEELKLPAGILADDYTAVALFNCRLPHLKRLHVGLLHSWQKPHLVRFLDAHPTLESLTWDAHCLRSTRTPPPIALPVSRARLSPDALPNLTRLATLNGRFLERVLHRKPPGSVRLTHLSVVPLTPRFLRLLAALDPAALTHIRLAAASDPALLPALASRFPNLAYLELGAFEWRADLGTMVREAVAHAVGHVLLRGRSPYERMEGLSLEEVVRWFPRLEGVKGVEELVGGAEEMGQIRERYPRLVRVNQLWVR